VGFVCAGVFGCFGDWTVFCMPVVNGGNVVAPHHCHALAAQETLPMPFNKHQDAYWPINPPVGHHHGMANREA
jgi:hypothetical protein